MGRDREGDKTTAVAPPGALTALLGEVASAPPLPSWIDSLAPGMRVGRFELRRELGRGGFGVVWEARDRELGRSVAFKAVKAGDVGGVREERLVREAEAAARLSHPNVVTLFDIGRSEHGPYLILELLRGETLLQRLLRGPLAAREALRVATDVARGLAHAHAAGVLHRDVKPGNIFVCADGLVKLLDLGMARAFGHKAFAGGSPWYMAPEQWQGREEDERTDVFALGVVLHEMLAGDVPWPGEEGKGVLGSAPPAPLDVPAAPGLAALVGRMIERDPHRRPRDAGAVLAELEAVSRSLDQPAARDEKTRTGWFALAGAALGRRREAGGAAAPPPGPSIAVLPFADLSPDHDQEHLSDGVAEEILNELTHVEGLRVAGRTSSFAFRGLAADVREIGRKLGVGAVVEGSVRTDGARLRVTANLIGVAEGLTLWSEQYDRQLTDLFAVQDEIARAVAGALQLKLMPGRGPGGAAERATSPEAYGHHLRGRQLHARGTPEGYRGAVEAHSSALAIDPEYAPAWSGVGIGLAMLWAAAGDESLAGVPDLRHRALEAAEKAVALAPGRSDGYAVRATLRAMTFAWRGAEEDIERALAIDPGDVRALRTRGWLLAAHGRIVESVEAEQRAGALDPLNPAGWVSLAVRHLALGVVPAAQEALALAAEVAPGSPAVRATRLLASLVAGDGEGSLAAAGELEDERSRLWGAALAHHALGRARASDVALDTLATRFGHRVAYPVAQVEAFRGRSDEAFRWLARALERREVALESIAFDPLFRGLQEDPRYAAVLAAMGLAPGGGGKALPTPAPLAARRQAETVARVADDAARLLQEERARAGGRSGHTVNILADAIAAAHNLTRLRAGRRWLKVVLAVAAVGALVAAVLGAVVLDQRRQLRALLAEKERIDQEIGRVEAAMEVEADPERLAELERKLADLSGSARSTIGEVAQRDSGAAQALEESGDDLDRAIRRILAKFDAGTYAVPPVFKQALREQVDALARAGNLKFVYARRNRHWKVITQEFAALGLPEELAYIAWAETQFDPGAESAAGAAGMWQMTAGTAREMGLRVDDVVDERFDVPKQTRAAARKIATLLAEFGSESFMLALASYNRGEAGVRRVLRSAALEKDGFRKEKRDFWHLYRLKRLPPETRDYVPRVLAAAVVCSDPERYGLEAPKP